ncbi:MAG: cyclic pyranopterin monophosphate synthase MoaC [Candidatus Lokiarchaeota archaeon]
MIDISDKDTILRIATASGKITLKEDTVKRIKNKDIQKGDVEEIVKITAINAVKKVPDLIPMCHPIPITKVSLSFNYESKTTIKIICTVKSLAKTGVEMEALTGVNVALLNVWDLVKMYEKNDDGQYPNTKISDIIVLEKIKKKG